jgi:hypothetical protein
MFPEIYWRKFEKLRKYSGDTWCWKIQNGHFKSASPSGYCETQFARSGINLRLKYQSQIKFKCHVGDSKENLKYKYSCPHGENITVGDKVEANAESSCIVRNIQ